MNSEDRQKPSVLAISSHVVRGSVGNRGVVFALEVLGFPVWSLPTIILPWHPGHSLATRIVPDSKQFSDLAENLAAAPWLREVGAIISGYIGDVAQIDAIAQLIKAVKAENPDALYVCDPVLGDGSQLYVPEPVAEGIRDRLIPLAGIATPNIFELGWLSGTEIPDAATLIAAAQTLGPGRVLVTSAHAMMASNTGTMLVEGNRAVMAEHRIIENAPKGLGDLMAALFTARLLEGKSGEESLRLATGSVFEILARTAKRGADELTLETDANSLRSPMAMIHMRQIMTRPPRRPPAS